MMKQQFHLKFTPLFLIGVLFLIAFPVQCQQEISATEKDANHVGKLIQWLRENGGIVNEKIEIRRADPIDPKSRFGMFAASDIGKKEILLRVPRRCLITGKEEGYDDEEEDEDYDDYHDSDDEDEEGGFHCTTTRNLIEEMKLGNDSYYAPYVNYLMAEPWGQLPSSWSTEGKMLLQTILERFTIHPLPPDGPTSWAGVWQTYCGGSSDKFEENAALMVVQRSWDSILIPVYDMMSHRNGKWLNTESNSVHDEKQAITVRAKRRIIAGDEIYTSHNMCEDCGNREYTYGTPEILRDYGFVEQYPQRWIFDFTGFQVNEKGTEPGNLSVSWIFDEPEYDDIVLLKNIQDGMAEVTAILEMPSTIIPSNEIAIIRKFHADITTATDSALKTALTDDNACSTEEQHCVVPSTRYDNLMQDNEIDYSSLVCGNMDEFLAFEDYKRYETIQSHYQDLGFKHNSQTNDVCFDLDTTCQICGNYRPHYHEMSVHYAARYLNNMKRALFVGGGDSMILYELLQYPSIELIVGLELDQTVPRMSFKYFGTQPHWDNDKVEWWFGDATKSLMMLPEEYFGSFDMVLVDLSETVMSLTVTKELDVMNALSLLLKPDGVMLKNEVYFAQMSDIFEHTLQYWYYDVPTICSQSMVLGSNSINFARQENLTDHDVHNILIGPLDYDKHFELHHDYAWRPNNRGKNCIRENDELEQVPLSQTNSPGIMMVVEAEELSLTVNTIDDMKELLTKTITNQNFDVLSTFVPETVNDDYMIIVVAMQGYIISHFWPDQNYCGFDIYLWSKFAKQKPLKEALLLAVGSGSSSSFRLLVSGMFGIDTWKDDLLSRGPRRTLPCDRPESLVVASSTKTMEVIIEEEMRHFSDGATVLVVCGLEDSVPCITLKTLEKVHNLGKIVNIWSCPNINEFAEDSTMQTYACEQNLLESLRKSLVHDKKLDAIIFDTTSSYSMGQILVRIFTNMKSRFSMLAKNPKILALSNNIEDYWRRILVNRFRTEVFEIDPVLKVDVSFRCNDSDIFVHCVVTDEKNIALRNLNRSLKAIEERSGSHANVEEFLGGGPPYEEYFTPTQVYSSDDYDQSSQKNQWSSQQPLGHQAIIQFEVQGSSNKLSRNNIKFALEQTLVSFDLVDNHSNTAQLKEISNIGDGYLIIALWPGCQAIVIWDGRKHVGINLIMDDEDFEFTAEFEITFIDQIPLLKTTLRDEHPRGYGKVVNFMEDLEDEDYPEPVWG